MIRTQCETNDIMGLALADGLNTVAVVSAEKLTRLLVVLNQWRARSVMGATSEHWQGGVEWTQSSPAPRRPMVTSRWT